MAIAPDILSGLAQRLAEHAGLELPAWVVEARAHARISALGCAPAEYLALVGSPRGADELAELIELVRVGETRLFRHLPQIDALVALVPPIVKARGRRAVRVWSAGCATGEEPYTLAVVLQKLLPGCEISILATDVSADALEVARGARYPAAALDRVPAAWRDGFIVDGGALRVRPELASLVRFEQGNLADDTERRRGFDVVWCRNVLIYFAAAARKRVVDRLIAALEPGGLLFVGYSETLRDVAELEPVRTDEAVAYARRTRAVTPPPVRRTPVSGVPVPIVAARSEPVDTGHRRLVIATGCDVAEVTRELGAMLATPGLQQLTVDLDAADLVPDELAPILRRARAAARAEGLALKVAATKAGAKRWARRHGLEDTP